MSSFDEFVQELGMKIESEFETEIYLKGAGSADIFKLNKSMFSKLCARCNSTDVAVEPPPTSPEQPESPPKQLELALDNLRIGDDLISDQKCPSARQVDEEEPASKTPRNAFINYIAELDDSAMFEGLGDPSPFHLKDSSLGAK